METVINLIVLFALVVLLIGTLVNGAGLFKKALSAHRKCRELERQLDLR